MSSELPRSLQEAIVYFSDIDRAHTAAIALRWPGKITCPRCECDQHSYISTRRIWFCKGCKKQFSVKVGTIFEDSPLSIDKWMTAVWLIVSCRNGISSYEVARAMRITQKSAWHMMHRIRKAMQSGTFEKLAGHIEADETFIGGKARNMHVGKRQRRITGTGTKDKTAVMGIMKRGGKVRTAVLPNRKKHALQTEVKKHVEAGSALYTDALLSYEGLASDYAHQVIDHAVQYVDGQVHTNGLENFWSLLKRGISGTYVSVEPFHLFRYLDEQAFRFNNRNMTDLDRFILAMNNINGKRLTYAEVTGKTQTEETQTYWKRAKTGRARKAKTSESVNTLYYGDNLEILRDEKRMPSESVDLCYIDPPFNSQRNYNQIYLITLREPTKPMREEAAHSAVYHHALTGRTINRVQIVTVRDMLDHGKRLDLPLSTDVLKQSPKHQEKTQLGLLD